MRNPENYQSTTKWTLAKGIAENDGLSLLIPFYGRIWTYPRQIISIWDKSNIADKGASYENEVSDKICYLGNIPPIKYATCTNGEELFTEETEIIVITSWDFIFENKEKADIAFRKITSKYKQFFEDTVAGEHELILQAKQALLY